MSAHHDFVFPKHPHLPAPDWRKLEQRLLEEEWVIPAVGPDVPQIALRDLHFGLGQLSEQHIYFDPTWRTTGVREEQAVYAVECGVPPAVGGWLH